MELPKNITQIGEADKHCRIYVEDYVVSYIKQMNGMAQNKDIAIALYGRKTAEDGVAYLFAYGSAKLNFLQKPVRHLSQAQEQEIEKLRRKYFSEMTFLGYRPDTEWRDGGRLPDLRTGDLPLCVGVCTVL